MLSPDLDSLRCFEAAARRLNFRQAAAEVGLSPSAFSERIARLEGFFGVELFTRTTRSVALSSAGRRLEPEVTRLFEQVRRCLDAARGPGALPPFTLRLGTRYELGLSWLVPAIDPLRATRPERSLDLHFGDSDDLLRRVVEGSIDAMISSARIARSGLEFAALHGEGYVLVAAPEVVACAPLCGPADAPAHRLLDLHPGLPLLRYLLDARPAGENWRFAGREHLGTIGAVRQRVLAGAGVAVLPRYFVRDVLATGRVVALLPETAPRSDLFRLIWREGHPLAAEMRSLGEELAALPLR